MAGINWNNDDVERVIRFAGYQYREPEWQRMFGQGVELAAEGEQLLQEARIAKDLGFDTPESRKVVLTIFGAAAKEGRRR